MTAFGVRPYEPRDREAVRRISFETGDAGLSAERYFPDRELFADLWTLYYTDAEPEACWVAEDGEGNVAGYLTGCLDDARFRRRLLRVGPRVFIRALARGSFLRPSLWRLLAANVPLWFRGGEPPSPSGRSSHFHMNLSSSLRGKGAGRALMDRYLAAAEAAGAAFVRAAVREDNGGARRFFEKLGFVEKGRRPAFRTPGPEGQEYAVALYIRLFAPNLSGPRP